MPGAVLRPTLVLVSATLMAIAMDPVPLPMSSFTKPVLSSSGQAVTTGDLDGDGYADVVIDGKIYWGSPIGIEDQSTSTQIVLPSSNNVLAGRAWIIPNMSGAGTDGKVRPDLIAVDQSGYALQVIKIQSRSLFTSFTNDVSNGMYVLGQPAVGDFNGDGRADIVWMSYNGVNAKLQDSNRTFTSSPTQASVSTTYSTLASIPALGGAADLIVVTQGANVFRFPSSTSFLSTLSFINRTIDATISPIYSSAQISFGDLDGNGEIDLAITGASSTSIIGNIAGAKQVINTSGVGWIIPDVTGDHLDDFTFSSTAQGLILGRTNIFGQGSQLTVDRPVPVDANSTPLYSFAGMRPVVIPVSTSNTPFLQGVGQDFTQQLLLIDSNRGNITLLPSLAPAVISFPSYVVADLPNVAVPLFPENYVSTWGSATHPFSTFEVALEVVEDTEGLSFVLPPTKSIPEPTATIISRGERTFKAYTFASSAATADECRDLLNSLQYLNTSESPQTESSNSRNVEFTATGSIQDSDIGSPYVGTNLLAVVTVAVVISPQDATAGQTTTVDLPMIVGDNNTFILDSSPTQGTANIDESGVLSYTPDSTASGSEDVVVLVNPFNSTDDRAQAINLQSSGGYRVIFRFSITPVTVPTQPLGLLVPGRSGSGVSLGETIRLVIHDGTPPYQVVGSSGAVTAGPLVTGGIDLDGDELTTDPGQVLLFTPSSVGTATVTITDAANAVVAADFTVTALPVAVLPAPVVTASVGTQTVFGAICPGTTAGVNSIRNAFAGMANNARARGFTWNAVEQAYRELPVEPTGGLLPTDGVFLATRVDLGLDFTGPALPAGTSLVLQANWNFVGLGPVQLTSGEVRTTHDLANDFDLTDLNGTAIATTGITQAYFWDGASYQGGTVMHAGVAYWIKNVSGAPALLRRKDSDFDGRSVHAAARFADAGVPPAPPAASSAPAETNATGGACGAGSGIAVMLASLAGFLKLRWRKA